jgi:hypothetical protein
MVVPTLTQLAFALLLNKEQFRVCLPFSFKKIEDLIKTCYALAQT